MATLKVTLSDRRTVQNAVLLEGKNLLATSPQGTKLFATVKAKKIQSFSATDKNGKKVAVTILKTKGAKAGGGVTCWVCIDSPGGRFCYPIDCSNLPSPKLTSKFF